ncbi:MAG: hypothetical protein F4Y45_16445 [Acidobacteria bacterium]|nr:hypothetical protein [Acidobacteriota bacterium]MYD70858.1 hypothetical protein [Acidobacteriota bacterium]MYJ05170.1 hypothetical protein [Acidobacteriota bacterium]
MTLLAPGRAEAQWNGFLHINGGQETADRVVADTLHVEIYGETATYDATTTTPGGTVVDAWAGLRTVGNLGVGIGVTVLDGRGVITLDGSVPSPLFRGRHRTLLHEQGGLNYRQSGLHVPVVYMIPFSERVHVAVLAGPSLFRVRHDALSAVSLGDEAAPYDTVSLTGLTTTSENGTGIGYHAGLDVTYLLTRWLGAGLLFRYTGGTVEFEMPGGPQSIDVGGAQASAGVRFRF